MKNSSGWTSRFKIFFLNNRFVLFLLILLLIGLNIMVLHKISYVFQPIFVLLKTVLLPMIFTGVMFYLLNPIVDLLEQKRVKRVYSILAMYLLIASILAVVIGIVVPLIRDQVASLIDNFPTYSKKAESQFEQIIGSEFFNNMQRTFNFDTDQLSASISERASAILRGTWSSLGGFLGALTETVLSLIMVPFILFYLLKDGKKLPAYILSFLPPALRPQTYRVMTETSHQISSYIRGQIIVSFCIGFLLLIGYLVIGLEYSLVLAIIAACTSIVPYLGPAIAIAPALIVASVTSPIMLLKMVVVWTIVQLIEGKFISPQIMGKTLQIHPITIIIVILTSGNLFGIPGIILAVPGYAVLKVIVSHLYMWFKIRSRLYETEE